MTRKNGFIEEIDDTIRHVKLDGAKEADYMTFQMMIDEERDEAREEGIKQERKNGIIKSIGMMKKLNATKEVVIRELSENYSLPLSDAVAIVEENW